MPKGLDEEAALLAIDPAKDADGLHPVNLGRLVMGAPGALPCTPHGIVELLHEFNVPVEGSHVVIVGRGLTIGRPLALLLALKRPGCNAAVTVVHTGVKNLADYTRQGDIVIAAAGAPNFIKADMIKPGAAVVGGGLTRGEGKKIISDVDDEVASCRQMDDASRRRRRPHDSRDAIAKHRRSGETRRYVRIEIVNGTHAPIFSR